MQGILQGVYLNELQRFQHIVYKQAVHHTREELWAFHGGPRVQYHGLTHPQHQGQVLCSLGSGCFSLFSVP